jgi:hypothetical protein
MQMFCRKWPTRWRRKTFCWFRSQGLEDSAFGHPFEWKSIKGGSLSGVSQHARRCA